MDRTIHYFQDRTDIWIVRSNISRIGLIVDRTIHYFHDRTELKKIVFQATVPQFLHALIPAYGVRIRGRPKSHVQRPN